MSREPRLIPVALIESRPVPDGGSVRPLFESVLRWGVLQPLIVCRAGARYTVIAGRKRLAAAVAAGLAEVPCLVFDVPEAEIGALSEAANIGCVPPAPPAVVPVAPHVVPAAVVQDLQETRAAIAGALALAGACSAKTTTLRTQVAGELVDVELQRLAWMLDAMLLVTSASQQPRTEVDGGALLREVAAAFQPECRLSGIDARVQVDPAAVIVRASERQLRAALSCAIGSVLTLVHAAEAPRAVLVMAARKVPGLALFSVAQSAVPVEVCLRLRGTPRAGNAETGGAGPAAFGLDAVRRVADAYRGRLELRDDGSSGGCVLELVLPDA